MHCKGHGNECTWVRIPTSCLLRPDRTLRRRSSADLTVSTFAFCQFLPIAETRFKRAKPKEDPLANLSGPTPTAPTAGSTPIFNLPSQSVAGQIFPLDAPQRSSSNGSLHEHSTGPRKEARLVGPTSISHLMHSVSSRAVSLLAKLQLMFAEPPRRHLRSLPNEWCVSQSRAQLQKTGLTCRGRI